jgi:phospholipase/carboxylesterase
MAPTDSGRSLFGVESGTLDFTIETRWLLFVPQGGAPPERGWPLVVLLHGMGMTAEQFSLVLNDLLVPGAAYLFPQGPFPYEIRKEGRIRIGHAWYLYDGHEEPFRTTLQQAEGHVLKVIDRVQDQLPVDKDRVLLLGFSMGAYLGYFMAFRNSERFAGMIGVGGRMKEEFVADNLKTAARFPVLMIHGEKDRSVPLERAELTLEALKRHGFPVEMKTFPVGHEIQTVEIEAMKSWIAERIR